MANANLESKVLKLLGTDASSEKTQDGLKFFLPFSSFEIEHCGQKYRFPAGILGIEYREDSNEVSYPYIVGRYSHPCLPRINEEMQLIYVCPAYRLCKEPEHNIGQKMRLAWNMLTHPRVDESFYPTFPFKQYLVR